MKRNYPKMRKGKLTNEQRLAIPELLKKHTQRRLADFLDVSLSTVQLWAKKGG